jgi:hypothetical protein
MTQALNIEKADWMVGTNGGKDYVVIAREQGIALGIKVVEESGGGVACFGVRIRAALDPNPPADQPLIIVPDVAKQADSIFPIEYTKKDYDRSSIGIVAQGPLPPTLEDFNKIVSSKAGTGTMRATIIGELSKIETKLLYTLEDIADWVMSGVAEKVDLIRHNVYPNEMQQAGKTPEKGKVVSVDFGQGKTKH